MTEETKQESNTPPVPTTIVDAKPVLKEDPDKTLAIIGLVLAFIVPLIGLIFSIVAKVKSKKSGFKNPIATIGIILNGVFSLVIILGIALLIVFGVFIFNTASKANDRDKQRKEDIIYIGKNLQTYVSENGYFPETLSEISSVSGFDVSKLSDPSGMSYGYEVIPEGCDKQVDCTGYIITAKAEIEVNGKSNFTYSHSIDQ